MIVAAGNIDHTSVLQPTHKSRCGEIRLCAMTQLAIVIVSTGVKFTLLGYEGKTFTTICRRYLSDFGVFKGFNLLWLGYPIKDLNKMRILRSIIAMTELSAAVESYCVNFTLFRQHSNVLIPCRYLSYIQIIKEPNLCWCISFLCIT